MRCWCALLLLAAKEQVVDAFTLAAAVPQSTFMAVNWSLVAAVDVSSASRAAPTGCACVGGDSACPFFECRCACDLTAGACDPFCCCDLECTEEQVAAARSQGLCSPDPGDGAEASVNSAAVEYCATDLALGKTRAAMNALVAESVLCVAVDNNEVAGEYFAAAPETQMTVASAFRANPKPLSFGSSALESPPAGLTDLSTSAKTAYSLGDAIRTFAVAADTKPIHAPVLSGFGAAVGSNECSELNVVRFEFVQEAVSCTRKAVALESACRDPAGVLTVAPFVQNILVAKRPNVTSSAAAADVLVVEVEVEEFDFTSGVITLLAPPLPSYFPVPEFSKSSRVCHGALVRLEYLVFHDALGHLTRVRAKVTVGNVSAALPDASASASAPATSVDIAQSFAVTFQSESSLPSGVVSLSNGNVQQYQRSGNPGYQLHYPVRVGVVETQSASSVSVISEMTGGLLIPGLGECSSSALADQTVGFGEDSQTSCSLSLTADDFKALCTRSEPLLPPLRVNFTRVAMFGNADPLLEKVWLALDYDAPTRNTAAFSDALEPGSVELTCRDVIASVSVEFLVARVGPVANPQHKIIAARVFHSKETWTFWRSATSPAKKQTFLLHTTVNFVFVQSTQLEQLIPPPPPIWFSIPSDVFYPFVLNDAARAPARLSWELLCLLWAVAAFVQL